MKKEKDSKSNIAYSKLNLKNKDKLNLNKKRKELDKSKLNKKDKENYRIRDCYLLKKKKKDKSYWSLNK